MKTRFDLQLMAADKILEYVPEQVLASIKAKDEHPVFRAYAVGEEGASTPNVVGVGGRILNWMRSAIAALSQKLRFGLQFFYEHGETNAHDGRQAIGELVGKALEFVGGKMRAVAVAYIYPQFQDLKADAASIEAQIDLDPTGRNSTVADVHVGDVTGIALFDSKKHKPAFASARLLSQLQAWDTQAQGGRMEQEMTLEGVKNFIKTARVKPSEVFDRATLLSDDLVGNHVLEKLNGEYARRRIAEESLENINKEMPEKIKKLEMENRSLKQNVASGRAAALIKKIAADRKLPEKKQQFVEVKMPGFKLEGDAVDDAAIVAQLNKFVDEQIDEYDKMAAIFIPKAEGQHDAGTAGAGDNGKGSMGQRENPLLKQT